MANLVKSHKVVSSLPGVLQPSSIYFVRVGTGFDVYVTNSTGTIVSYPLNNPNLLVVTVDPPSPSIGAQWIFSVSLPQIIGFFGAMPIIVSVNKYFISIQTLDGIKRKELE